MLINNFLRYSHKIQFAAEKRLVFRPIFSYAHFLQHTEMEMDVQMIIVQMQIYGRKLNNNFSSGKISHHDSCFEPMKK